MGVEVSRVRCAICNCKLHRSGRYATDDAEGQSHLPKHHYVAERFVGRSANRRGTKRSPIFERCPWDQERETAIYCYECHEELLHNPVLLPEDIILFALLVRQRGLSEDEKSIKRDRIAGRMELLHEVIAAGLVQLIHKTAAAKAASQ